MSFCVDNGWDLLALEVLMATLRDWLAICQNSVPRVLRLGVSMPAVTTRLDRTKADMRKGRKTASPVSVAVRRRSLSGKGWAYLGGLLSQQSSSLSKGLRPLIL